LRRRRSASRLIKIVGGDGNRSIKWGYLEHKIAQDDTSRDVTEPDSHLATEAHLALGQALGQVGQSGQVAEQDRHAPQPNPDLDPSIWDAEELRDSELDAAPDVCGYCGVTIGTRKYYKPWWVVRCRAHSPLTFHEKGSADAVGGIGTDDGDQDV
jgi:hypothetical protein